MNNPNDLISRAAALEALGECPYNWNDWPEEIQAVDDWKSYKEEIENLPAVDAAPIVHGRWVYEHGDPAMLPCSICGYQVFRYNNTRYCPNCGARMDDESRVRSELL